MHNTADLANKDTFGSDNIMLFREASSINVSFLWRFYLSEYILDQIVFPNAVVVEFSPNSYVVNEKDGNVMFVIVKRTPSSYNVTVRISTVDGSAKSGQFPLPSVTLTQCIFTLT